MNNPIVSYELGSFVDFKGVERSVVACAISDSVMDGLNASWENYGDRYEIVRAISIGISVHNPEDPFDLKQGKEIAYKRAISNGPSILICKGGVFDENTTTALLKKSIKNFSKNPESVIKGYKKAMKRYQELLESQEYIDDADDNEAAVIDALANGVNIEEVAKRAKPYLNALKNESKLVD